MDDPVVRAHLETVLRALVTPHQLDPGVQTPLTSDFLVVHKTDKHCFPLPDNHVLEIDQVRIQIFNGDFRDGDIGP